MDSAGRHALVPARAAAKDKAWQRAILPGRRAVQHVTAAAARLQLEMVEDAGVIADAKPESILANRSR